MATFAVVNDGAVINVILAESEEIATEVSGTEVVEIVDGVPAIAWTLESDGWRPPRPYASWEWNGEFWLPPIPYPMDNPEIAYTWDEEQGDWVAVVEPEPAPEE